MSAFAREGQKILMAAVFASDPGKIIIENTAIEITIDHMLDIRTEKPILLTCSPMVSSVVGLNTLCILLMEK